MTDDEIIAVVQAHKDGKQIQIKCIFHESESDWQDIENPEWQFGQSRYRVKPEPRKPREWPAAVLDNGTAIITNGAIAKVPTACSIIEIIRVREVIE